jgi:hypothetical protein
MRHTPLEPPLYEHTYTGRSGCGHTRRGSQILQRVAPVRPVSVARMAAPKATHKNQANRPTDTFGTCVYSLHKSHLSSAA